MVGARAFHRIGLLIMWGCLLTAFAGAVCLVLGAVGVLR